MNNFRLKNPWQLFGYFLLLILIVHANFLFPGKTISPDAQFILASLEKYSSLTDYLWNLIQLKGIDFQPLRDLSLFIDLKIFRVTGLNLSIFFNCMLWAGVCYQATKIYEEHISESDVFALMVLSLLAVHPVVSQSINWTMARKHILAVFFILKATRNYLNQKSFTGYYLLSLLSAPVALLWPFWAYFIDRKRPKLKIITAFFIMLIIAGLNYAYYFVSQSFRENFAQKSGGIDSYGMLFHFAKHFRQIFFPVDLTFHYQLNPTDLYGMIGVALLFVIVLIKFRSVRNWFLFALIPLPLFLRTPNAYYDTYVLIPFVGVILVFLSGFKDKKRLVAIPASILVILFGAITFTSNSVWGNLIAFNQKNFDTSPSCNSARQLAINTYLKQKKLSQDVYEFIQVNQCLNPGPEDGPINLQLARHIEALQLLVEDEVDLEFRKSRLLEMGTVNYYPLLIYASLMAKQNDPLEIERVMEILNEKFTGLELKLDYDEVYSEILPEYCTKMKLENCLRLTQRFSPQTHEPFL
ncbi:MAG: hypothetical protein V4598_15450 [Bdellovibrionota bacterium]